MPRPYTPTRVSTFEGLVDDVPIEIDEAQASTLQNLYRIRKKLVRRKGTNPLAAALSPDQNLNGVFWAKIGSTEYLIANSNGSLGDWFNATPGTVLSGGTGVLTNADTGFCWINKQVYAGDGVSQNVYFDGASVKQAMVAPPAGACTAAADGAGLGNGTYTFVYCFLAANGQLSEPSPASAPVVLTAQKANLASVAVSAEPGVTARYIFATGGGRTDYTLVNILNNNSATTVTTDLSGIINPLSPLLFGNTRFPPCRYLVEHQSRMIGAWCSTADGDKQTVYVSNQLQPWWAPAAPDLTVASNGTQAQLQGAAAAEITGLCSHGDFCAVFTGGAGWFLIGTEAADFRLQRFSNHGCVAHRTIQSTRHLLIWLAPDGVYAWNGIAVERISEQVRETITAMSAADMASAHSFVWYDRFYLMWPGHCLFYDLLNRNWGSHTAWDWRCSTVSTFTSSQQQRLYAGQTGHSRVWQLETGATDNGVAIPSVWVSRDWEMGMPAHEKRVHLVETKWKKSTGFATVRLYMGTGALIQTFIQDLSVVDYAGGGVVRLLASAVEQARDENFRLEVDSSTLDADYELLAAGVQFTLAK
jgi:hypothetical protein